MILHERQHMPSLTEKFREKLHEIKSLKGWSIAEFADQCGLPKSTMASYLNGVTPSLDAIEKISRGTKISVAALLNSWTSAHGSEDYIYLAAANELEEFFIDQISRAERGMRHDLIIEHGSIGGTSAQALARFLAQDISATAQGLDKLTSQSKLDN
jgi:transcriptional regulator with XRE-family HTH domain